MNDNPINWPRVKGLPPPEREAFLDFLSNQTRPWLEGVPTDEQDGYYESDYLNFKRTPATRYWD